MRIKESISSTQVELTKTDFAPDQKEKDSFRFYDENPTTIQGQLVKRTYYEMHTRQTVEYVRAQIAHWTRFDKSAMTIMEALERLNDFTDESDPDTDLPNSFHAYQTAERIREKHPEQDWFHLVGLIHDLGKVMGMDGQPQWSTVGDTYPVGMCPRESIVFGTKSFAECPDMKDPRYQSHMGIYNASCGLDNVLMSWGHDEYLYQVLVNHPGCTLPKEGLWCVRYHSFYPWHDRGDYMDLCCDEDVARLKWVKEFNQFDLYSKSDEIPDVQALKPYYQSLVDKYVPGVIRW